VAAYVVLLIVFWAPLVVTPYLPGLDLPFHLALADMLGKSGDAGSPYSGFYTARLWPPPPALSWLLLAALGRIVSGTIALKLVVAAYVAALPLATAALARRFGGNAFIGLLAFPLAYNMPLHYGFLAYTISLPVLLIAIERTAAVLEARARPASLVVAACALYGCHLESFALGVVAALAMIALARAPLQPRLVAVAGWLPSLAIAAGWHYGTPFAVGAARRPLGGALEAAIAMRRLDMGPLSLWGSLESRLVGLPIHLLRGFRDGVDRLGSTGLLVLVVVLVLATFWRALRGAAPAALARSRFVLPVVALVAYLGLPHHLDEYEAMSLFPRLGVVVVLAALASIPLRLSLRHVAAGAGVLSLLALVWGVMLVREYRAFGSEARELETVLAQVPGGGRAVGLVFDGESRVMDVESIFRGSPSLYVASHPAPKSMVALRYCGMRHVPCSLGPKAVPAPNPWTPESFDAVSLGFFDYVLVRGTAPAFVSNQPAIAHAGAWTAYVTARRSTR
jgi:hypothetical protein